MVSHSRVFALGDVSGVEAPPPDALPATAQVRCQNLTPVHCSFVQLLGRCCLDVACTPTSVLITMCSSCPSRMELDMALMKIVIETVRYQQVLLAGCVSAGRLRCLEFVGCDQQSPPTALQACGKLIGAWTSGRLPIPPILGVTCIFQILSTRRYQHLGDMMSLGAVNGAVTFPVHLPPPLAGVLQVRRC